MNADSQPPQELPPSLDFFKYAKGRHQKTNIIAKAEQQDSSDENNQDKHFGRKRRRKCDESDDESSTKAPALRHRVTTKGQRVPSKAESFQEMQTRYKFPVYIMQNIRASNYIEPTPIQQVGVPILAEVGRNLATKNRC